MSHVFISYSLEDGIFARQLADRLLREGFDIWIDGRVEHHQQWHVAIERGVKDADIVVVIMSPTSQASRLVQREVALAKENGRTIVPMLLEGSNWFANLSSVNVTDKQLPPDDFFKNLAKYITPTALPGGNIASATYADRQERIHSTMSAAQDSNNGARATTQALVVRPDSHFQFVVEQGPEEGRGIPLDKNTITVGRERSNDITIVDAELSRYHARLTLSESGYIIEDLGSTNGTFVNGKRIAQPTMLNAGDVVRMGSYVTLNYERKTNDMPAPDVTEEIPIEQYAELPAKTGQPRLIMRNGPQLNRVMILDQAVMTIGRLPSNDIIINDPEVSRHHCSLSGDASHGYKIEDLGSTNGTQINNQRIEGKKKLEHGDIVMLGPNIVLGYVE